MPKYLSNLKNIYRKTYEELTNPKSPIGVFLAGIDKYVALEHAEDIKKAVNDYIKMFEEEEKNFVEPEPGEEKVSYKREQQRLRKNLAVEKRLSEAVQRMNDALDVFAEHTLEEKPTYTAEDIKNMKDYTQKIRAQRDRVLNATYKLEVDLEKEMFQKLKSEYREFDHRPPESKTTLPPYVKDSKHYRIRHMPLKGGAKIPTFLYGSIRFRDLLNDHERLIKEAERSRQYEVFVNDRLAGHQAWKHTLEKEAQIYEEIKGNVDPKYFEAYDNFMKDRPMTSTLQGYRTWYANTNKNIMKMDKQLKQYQREQKQFDEAYVNLTKYLSEEISNSKLVLEDIDSKLKAIDDSPILTEEYFKQNEQIKSQAEGQLVDLEQELETLNEEIRKQEEEQEIAKQAWMKQVEEVGHFSDELNKLEEAMQTDPKKALEAFLDDYAKGAVALDQSLKDTVDELKASAEIIEKNTKDVKDAEEAITKFSDKVDEWRKNIDEITAEYNEIKKKSDKDLKREKGVGKALVRFFSFGENKERHKAELDAAIDQDQMVKKYEDTLTMLQNNVKTNERLRDLEQEKLKGYQDGWNKMHEKLKVLIKNGQQYTKDIQEKLTQINIEREKTQREYEAKVKEIQADTKEKQEANQEILKKTEWDMDTYEGRRLRKEIEKKQLQDQIKETQDRIEKCKKDAELIEITKGDRETLVASREEHLRNTKLRQQELENDIETAKYRCGVAKQQWQELEAKYRTAIESHKKMKEFYEEGKATSSRVLTDLNNALTETLKIASQESQKQLEYMKEKENGLMIEYMNKMNNPKMYGDRINVGKDAKAGVYEYLQKLDSMKTFNSKVFNNLKNAILKQYDKDGNFFLNLDNVAGIKRDENLNNVKENLKEIADCAKAYLQEKGGAQRRTNGGKERYRFADEMRTIAETMLSQYEMFDKEKEMTEKLMVMDDSDIFVNRFISFDKTESYKMTRNAFVKKGEVDKMDMMGLGTDLKEEEMDDLEPLQEVEHMDEKELDELDAMENEMNDEMSFR